MLKIERRRENSECHVILGNYGRILTPTFVKALSVAFFLHFIAWMIFQITPLKVQETIIFSHTEARLDRFLQDQVVLAESTDERELFPIGEPRLSTPIWNPKVHSAQEWKSDMFYAGLKERRYSFEGFKMPSNEKDSRMVINTHEHIKISGPLSERSFTISRRLFEKKGVYGRVVYDVKVDGSTGKIFFAVPLEKPLTRALNKRGRAVLEEIIFEKDDLHFIWTGTIELEFPKENSETTIEPAENTEGKLNSSSMFSAGSVVSI